MIYKLAHSFLTLSVISIIFRIWFNYSRFLEVDTRDYFRIPILILLILYIAFDSKVDWKSLPTVKKILFNVAVWVAVFLVWGTTVRGGLGGDPGLKTASMLLFFSLLCAGLLFIRNLAIASWLIILGTHILTVHNYNTPDLSYEHAYSSSISLWADYSENMMGISLVIGGVLLFLDDLVFIIKSKRSNYD